VVPLLLDTIVPTSIVSLKYLTTSFFHLIQHSWGDGYTDNCVTTCHSGTIAEDDNFTTVMKTTRARVSVVVKALCYKLEDRRLETQ
jgi:hypothetical protein